VVDWIFGVVGELLCMLTAFVGDIFLGALHEEAFFLWVCGGVWFGGGRFLDGGGWVSGARVCEGGAEGFGSGDGVAV
jgi:hypothetical protein